MEVIPTLVRWWRAFAEAMAAFLDEAAFRVSFACGVLFGRLPRQAERRRWNRSAEAPVAVRVCDFTDGRCIFTALIWPPLESPAGEALAAHEERLKQVKEVITKGSGRMALSTFLETDYGLRWDHERQVWSATGGSAFDGKDTYDAA